MTNNASDPWTLIRNPLMISLADPLGFPPLRPLWNSLGESLRASLWVAIWVSLGVSLRASLKESLRGV